MKAGMRFTHERLKDHFINIDEILFNRRDNDHIVPKNNSDFDPKHLYSVYWCYCEGDSCTDDGQKCKYYKGYIFGLGENEEEILKNYNESGSRISFRKEVSESDSPDDDTSHSQKLKKKAAKQIASTVMKQNSDRIRDKFKHRKFLDSRQKLNIEPQSVEDDQSQLDSTVTINSKEKLREKCSKSRVSVVLSKLAVEKRQLSNKDVSPKVINSASIQSKETTKRCLLKDYTKEPSTSKSINTGIYETQTKKSKTSNTEICESDSNLDEVTGKVDFDKENKLLDNSDNDSDNANDILNKKNDNGSDNTGDIVNKKKDLCNKSNGNANEKENINIESDQQHNDCGNEQSHNFDDVNGFSGHYDDPCNDTTQNDVDHAAVDNGENDATNGNVNLGINGNNHEFANVNRRRRTLNNSRNGAVRNPIDDVSSDDSDLSISDDERDSNVDSSSGGTSSSNDDSDNEDENLEALQNDPDWGHIKCYRYKLYQYLKKECVGAQNDPILNNDEPALYTENNKKVYLGFGKYVGSVTWKLTQSQKDDKFLRDIAKIIWNKKTLSNRCLDLKRVNKKIPGRSPVKLVTPKKLNHLFRIYRNHLIDKQYADDRVRICVRRSTRTLSYLIRDLRAKAIRKAKKRLRRLRRRTN